MTLVIPDRDGEVNCYNLFNSAVTKPRIYFVNGIRVIGREHAVTAALLSLLVHRPIWGVYNKTSGTISGLVLDLFQCALDYTQNATARPFSGKNANRPPVPDSEVPALLEKVKRNSIIWNSATFQLFSEIVEHRHDQIMIIAHSQGNLITSNALFIVEDMLGASALQNVRVYSLASPSPAWPLGLRITNGGGGRQDNAFMNDLVALLRPHNLAAKVGVNKFQNRGDFRTDNTSLPVSLAPHDTKLNIALNFLKSIRGDLGMIKDLPPEYLKKCAAKAEHSVSKNRTFLQWLDDTF